MSGSKIKTSVLQPPQHNYTNIINFVECKEQDEHTADTLNL